MSQTLQVKFNNQQIDLLKSLLLDNELADGLPGLVRRAILCAQPFTEPTLMPAPQAALQRKVLSEYLIEPGKGRAIEVKRAGASHRAG